MIVNRCRIMIVHEVLSMIISAQHTQNARKQLTSRHCGPYSVALSRIGDRREGGLP